MYAALGTALREVREDHELTQRQIAKIANANQSNISKLEGGKIKDAPRKLAEIITAYAQASGVRPAALIRRWAAELDSRSRSR